MCARSTPITNQDATTRYAALPLGWSRVWSGIIFVGDAYLNWVKFWETGDVEWIPYTFDSAMKGHEWENNAGWFGCLIREKAEDVGQPCIMCQVCPPLEELDFCSNCALTLYPAESDE